MQLVLDTEGLFLNAYRGAFQVKKDDMVKRISPKKITSIAITANVLIHSRAVKLAVENQIPPDSYRDYFLIILERRKLGFGVRILRILPR
ncbi:MAG: hypothetical protein HC803_06845 [Saprospiraceae bacterium]|nr:hypothetical protein [Saprospiraceae bacterium]